MSTFRVTYSNEQGDRAEHTFTTLEAASQLAAEMVYSLSGEPFAGFPVAVDTYPVQTGDGVNHTVTVEEVEPVVLSATARHISFEGFGPVKRVVDANTGQVIGQCDTIFGFAHYYGAAGSAHEGMTAVVRGGVEGLRAALAEGLRNGRDDREPVEPLPCEGKVHTVFGREVSAADHHAMRAVDADHPGPAAAPVADAEPEQARDAVLEAALRGRIALELEHLSAEDAKKLYRPKWQRAVRDAAAFVRKGGAADEITAETLRVAQDHADGVSADPDVRDRALLAFFGVEVR